MPYAEGAMDLILDDPEIDADVPIHSTLVRRSPITFSPDVRIYEIMLANDLTSHSNRPGRVCR